MVDGHGVLKANDQQTSELYSSNSTWLPENRTWNTARVTNSSAR